MPIVNSDWLRSRANVNNTPKVRLGIRMLKNRSRFKEGIEYHVPHSVAHGLVDAKCAVFLDTADNPVITESREPTLKELQNEAAIYNISIFDYKYRTASDTLIEAFKTPFQLKEDIAAAEVLVEQKMKLTKENLISQCEERKLSVLGKKSDLVARLVTHDVRNRGM